MRKVVISRNAGIGYAISAVLFVIGIVTLLMGDESIGKAVGLAGFSLAYSIASANDHLTTRKHKSKTS